MTHTIDVKELAQWRLEHRVLYSSSSKENKKLYVTMSGGYEIEVKGVIVYECIQSYEAVEKYNSIKA